MSISTLGIYGGGEVGKRAVARLIPQHLGDDAKGRFVFLVDDTWNTGQDVLLDYAVEHGDPLCIIPAGDEFAEDALGDGIPYQESDDPYNTFMDLIKAEGGDLVLVWTDTDEENLTSIADDALGDGIAVFDLMHGMRPLTQEAAEETEEAPEPEEEETEEEDVDPYEGFLDALDACESVDLVEDVLSDKDNRDETVRLGLELGIDYNPSGWQSKWVPRILERLAATPFATDDMSIRDVLAAEAGEPDPEVPDTSEPPVADVVIPDPEVVDERQDEEPVEVHHGEGTVNIANVANPYEDDERWARESLRHDVTEFAVAHGLEAAKEFLAFLRDEGLA